MELVITLIADPGKAPLTETLAGQAAAEFKAGPPDWLAENTACDLTVEGDLDAVRKQAAQSELADRIDIIVQPAANRRKKLLLADMDSTIVTSETLDELADHAGLKEKIAGITARAMRGELDFQAALSERVGMLKGLPEQALEDTWEKVQLTPGARELVRTMSANGARCVLVSGGFRYFTGRVAEMVGFDEDYANTLIIENGVLTGKVGEPILDKDSKLSTLERLLGDLALDRSQTMTVGDGANDLPMILAAGLGVAFHAKPVVEAEAPARVRFGDLTALLYMQGYRRDAFRK